MTYARSPGAGRMSGVCASAPPSSSNAMRRTGSCSTAPRVALSVTIHSMPESATVNSRRAFGWEGSSGR